MSSNLSTFIDAQINTARLASGRKRGRNVGGLAPRGSSGAKNLGRTSVITPQSFVAFTVNPSYNMSMRLKGDNDKCLAPYCEDVEAHRGYEGEIAWIWNHDFIARTGSTATAVAPSVNVFVNLAGIAITDAGKIRPIGMLKNGGRANGIADRQGQAGVVIGMGLVTLINTGPNPMIAGHLAWVSPFPWTRKSAEGRVTQGLETVFVHKGKWYGATYTLTEGNVAGVTRHLNDLFKPLMKAGCKLSKQELARISKEQIQQTVREYMESELDLQECMPMFTYGYLKAATRLLDMGGDGDFLPVAVKQFALFALNEANKNLELIAYNRMLGVETIAQQKVSLQSEQVKKAGYIEFNKLYRGRLEDALALMITRSWRWIEPLIIGVIVTGADSGRQWDCLLGYKQ